MKPDPLRNVYRAFSALGLLALLAIIAGYPLGRALALADNRSDASR
ncbi:MAG TPA: hypothetical protein VM687_04035 [Stenotrophomonas sp.]|nr:hypothetical protein [Stenotrophomonas sp.]